MSIINHQDNYTLGRGELWFRAFTPGTRTPVGGARFLGNVPTFTLNVAAQKLTHTKSTGGVNQEDFSIVTSITRSATISAEDVSAENLAIYFLGDVNTLTQAAATGTTETFTGVAPDLMFRFGVTDANPTGIKMLSNVVLKKAAATLVAGTDYTIDADRGIWTPIAGGALVKGDTVTATYDVGACSRDQVISGSSSVQGELLYLSYAAAGETKDFLMPFVELSPNGDFTLIADQALQTIPLSVDVKTNGNKAAVYADGAVYVQ